MFVFLDSLLAGETSSPQKAPPDSARDGTRLSLTPLAFGDVARSQESPIEVMRFGSVFPMVFPWCELARTRLERPYFQKALTQLVGRDLFFTFEQGFVLDRDLHTGVDWHVGTQTFGYRPTDEFASGGRPRSTRPLRSGPRQLTINSRTWTA